MSDIVSIELTDEQAAAERLEGVLQQVRRNAQAVPATVGMTAGDRRRSTESQMKNAVQRVAHRFRLSEAGAIKVLEARDVYHSLGFVQASYLIIKENPRRTNRY